MLMKKLLWSVLVAAAVIILFLIFSRIALAKGHDDDHGHPKPTPTPEICYDYKDKIVEVESYYTCNEGWVLDGTNCLQKVTKYADQNRDHQCPTKDSDYKSSDSRKKCSRELVINTTEATKVPEVLVCPEGYSDNGDNCRMEVSCEPTVTPTPEPVITEAPQPGGGSGVSDGRAPNPSAPTCNNPDTRSKPANVHVIRIPGSTTAEVKWFQTEGNQANIYYRESDANGWKHAVRDIEVKGGFGGVIIRELHSDREYIFGVQQKFGCAGGEVTSAIVLK